MSDIHQDQLTYDEIKAKLIDKFEYQPYNFRDVEAKGLQDDMRDLTNTYLTDYGWKLCDCWHFAGVELGIFYIGG